MGRFADFQLCFSLLSLWYFFEILTNTTKTSQLSRVVRVATQQTSICENHPTISNDLWQLRKLSQESTQLCLGCQGSGVRRDIQLQIGLVHPNGKKLGLSAYWDRNLQNEQDRLLIPTAAYIWWKCMSRIQMSKSKYSYMYTYLYCMKLWSLEENA